MEEHRRQTENNLLGFIRAYFVPARLALDAADDPGSNHILRHSRAALLESFWWLYLGAELGYFSREGVALLWDDANQLYGAAFESLSRQRGVFSERLWFATQRTLRVKDDLFKFDDNMTFKQPATLLAAFQTILMEESRFARDSAAKTLCIFIAYPTVPEWRRMMEDKVLLGEVGDPLLGQPDHSPGMTKKEVYAGFFRALEHMTTYQYIFHHLRRNPRIAEADAYLLERRSKEVANWRLNFNVGDARDRFLQITEDVAEKAIEELRTQNVALEQSPKASDFIKQVEAVIESWGNTQLLVHSAGK